MIGLKNNIMKKKLLLFIFFLGSLFAHGQTDYAILIKSKITSNSVWPGNDYNGLHQITAGLNSCSIYFFEENYKDDLYCFFYVTDDPKELSFTEILGGSPICGQIRRTTAYNKDNFAGWFFSGCLANSQIMSLHIPEQGITPKCNEDIITLKNGWNWRYQLQGGQWEDFPPQFQAQPSISFKIKDLAGYSNQLSIRFQSGYQGQFTNIVTYDLIPCSPKLDNTSDENFTTCSYSNGGVTFTFSRPLENGEKYLFTRTLVGSGFFTSAPSNDPNIEKISELSYKWKNIPPGQYEFKYQTQFENNTPSTLSTISKFTIKPQTALTFTATAVQPACSTDKGGIQISVQGGTAPYFYILNDETEAIDGEIVLKKIKLPDSNFIPITKDGEHKVIIVDNSDCIEK